MTSALRPCFRALQRERSLPSCVFGPVDFWAFLRLITLRSALFMDVISTVSSGSWTLSITHYRDSARLRSVIREIVGWPVAARLDRLAWGRLCRPSRCAAGTAGAMVRRSTGIRLTRRATAGMATPHPALPRKGGGNRCCLPLEIEIPPPLRGRVRVGGMKAVEAHPSVTMRTGHPNRRGESQRRHGLLSGHAREVFQEIGEGLTGLKVIEERAPPVGQDIGVVG